MKRSSNDCLRYQGTEERLRRLKGDGPTKVHLRVPYGLNPFMCMLAKIGHGFATAAHDGEFVPLLPDYILDRDRRLSHTIGSATEIIKDPPSGTFDPSVNAIHAWSVGIRSINGRHYVVVLVQLFRYLDAPVYEVVAGEASASLVTRVLG